MYIFCIYIVIIYILYIYCAYCLYECNSHPLCEELPWLIYCICIVNVLYICCMLHVVCCILYIVCCIYIVLFVKNSPEWSGMYWIYLEYHIWKCWKWMYFPHECNSRPLWKEVICGIWELKRWMTADILKVNMDPTSHSRRMYLIKQIILKLIFHFKICERRNTYRESNLKRRKTLFNRRMKIFQ